jgi:hypothetical protein
MLAIVIPQVIRAVDIRPVSGARSVIEPIMAARMIDGDEPTKRTNPAITRVVRMLQTSRGRKGLKAPKKSFVRIVIFIPDSAAIWSVPVTTSAS